MFPHSCYGAETAQLSCCNSCADVREAYRLKGWAFNNPKGIEQCVSEGFTDKLDEQTKEGCKVKGYIEVNKVGGNIHFAPGKSFQQHNVHGMASSRCRVQSAWQSDIGSMLHQIRCLVKASLQV